MTGAYTNVLFLLVALIKLERTSSQPNGESSVQEPKNDDSATIENSNNVCTLYMAESSIPNSGLGIFSAIDIPIRGKVGSGDLVIPLFDSEFGPLINSYPWRGKEHGAHNEADEVDNLCPGINAIVNGHTSLMNIWAGSIDMDECDLHRSSDPGVGAFSYYHNLQTITTAPIAAGMELFAEYGDHYFTNNDPNGNFLHVPLSYDYEEADVIIAKFDGFRRGKEDEIAEESLQLFWEFFRNIQAGNSRVLSLLPDHVEGMKKAAEVGSSQFNAPKEFIRSIESLETNGLCMDNLKEGKSTISQAGRGAFATRHLSKGSFVAPIPLIHECKQDAFLSYGSKQLLLNYCFSHASSTLKLCPYGPLVSLINHNKTEANVEIRWSTSKLHKNELLELEKDELCAFEYAGLILDVVATKEILPGQEIFMNYGQEWEDAWNSHVRTWKPPPHAQNYKSASTLNKEESIIRTYKEQHQDPYPDNIYLECFFQSTGNYEEVDGVYYQDYSGHESPLDLHKCNVVSRVISLNDNTVYLYTVSMAFTPDYEDPYKVIVSNVPRNAVHFSDKSYTTDMFLTNAFRHLIMLPDEMFPKAWMDLESN